MTDVSAGLPVIHATVHAWTDMTLCPQPISLGGLSLSAFRVESNASWRSLSVGFDEAVDRLAKLPQLYIEPDGSFVWVSSQGAASGQVDGQLNDSSAGLISVELKISGPSADVFGILAALGWPEQRMLFQLVRQGVYLAESELRRLLARL